MNKQDDLSDQGCIRGKALWHTYKGIIYLNSVLTYLMAIFLKAMEN